MLGLLLACLPECAAADTTGRQTISRRVAEEGAQRWPISWGDRHLFPILHFDILVGRWRPCIGVFLRRNLSCCEHVANVGLSAWHLSLHVWWPGRVVLLLHSWQMLLILLLKLMLMLLLKLVLMVKSLLLILRGIVLMLLLLVQLVLLLLLEAEPLLILLLLMLLLV